VTRGEMATKAAKKKPAEVPLTVEPISKEYLRSFLTSEDVFFRLGPDPQEGA
jgi:hypothetical protein